MIKSITQPDGVIKTLIGEQKKKASSYRLSNYVISTVTADGVLYYNTLTCELVWSDSENIMDGTTMHELIAKWFLVPTEFNEFQFAKKIKRIRQLVMLKA